MSSGDAWASLRSKPCSAPFLTLIQNAYGGAGGEAVFNPANVGAAAAGGSASTAYANGGSGGSNENGSVAGAVASTTASTTLVGVGGAFGVSTAIGGGSVADGSGGGGATATTDVTAPGNATFGGPGASISVTNAVSGSTGEQLYLTQGAYGGYGGNTTGGGAVEREERGSSVLNVFDKGASALNVTARRGWRIRRLDRHRGQRRRGDRPCDCDLRHRLVGVRRRDR